MARGVDDEVDVKGTTGAGGKRSFTQRLHGIGSTIWNPAEGKFLGRTGCSWAKITLFYLIFYSCLAGFFAIMMAGFFATLSSTQPTMTGMYSLIKGNPGMGYRPRRAHDSTLIKFVANMDGGEKKGDYDTLVDKMMNFLREEGYVNDKNETVDREGNTTFSISEAVKHCPLHDFGYRAGKPCVILKLNKVFGWTPILYSASDNGTERYMEAEKALRERGGLIADHIGVSCEGENDGDVDNMGPVSYYPNEGFSTAHYPYENQPGYRAPLVFVQFTKPERGVVMQIWCKAWAKNIKHHKNDKGGSTHFELMVDGPDPDNPRHPPLQSTDGDETTVHSN